MKPVNFQAIIRSILPVLTVASMVACIAAPTHAGANLLTNGDFESNSSGNVSNADLPGWNDNPENHTHIDTNSIPGLGQYAALNHNGKNFSITQKFNVTDGSQYLLSYDFGVAKNTTLDENSLLVAVGPNSGPSFETTNSMAGPNRGQLWQTLTYTFTATKTGVFHILFASIGATDNPNDTTFVDNVSIRPVPEASTIVLFALLLVGGTVVMRKRHAA